MSDKELTPKEALRELLYGESLSIAGPSSILHSVVETLQSALAADIVEVPRETWEQVRAVGKFFDEVWCEERCKWGPRIADIPQQDCQECKYRIALTALEGEKE